MDSHGTDRPASEAPFSELIRRWWDEGDRLSEGVARAEAEAEAGRRKRVHELGASLRQWTSRHRMVVLAGAGLLSALGVVTLRFVARAELAASAAASVEVAAAPVVAPPRPPARPLAMPPVVVVAVAPASAPSATVAVAPSAEPASDPEPAFQRQPAVEAAPATKVVAPAKPEPAKPEPTKPEPVAKKPEPPSEPEPATVSVPAAVSAPVVAHAAARPAAPSAVAPSTEEGEHGSLLQACKRALDRERTRDALAACGRFAAAAPGSVEAIVSLARAELLAGREAETLRLARRASAIDPRCAEAYLLIGTAAQLTGRNPDARTAYQAYLHLAPRGLHAAEVRAILRTL